MSEQAKPSAAASAALAELQRRSKALPEPGLDAYVWYAETTAVTPSAVPEPFGAIAEALQDR